MPKLKAQPDGKVFKDAFVVHDPQVVEPETCKNGKKEFGWRVMEGRFYRVKPKTAEEWQLLYGLEPHRQKWAFAVGGGNGICVTEAVVYGNLA